MEEERRGEKGGGGLRRRLEQGEYKGNIGQIIYKSCWKTIYRCGRGEEEMERRRGRMREGRGGGWRRSLRRNIGHIIHESG